MIEFVDSFPLTSSGKIRRNGLRERGRNAISGPSVTDELPLAGQIAAVTGAGRGIGEAIALGFAKAGAAVSCGARTVAEIESTANAIRKRQSAALSVPFDVTDPDRVQHFFDHTAAEFGGIDIAVLNAGVAGEEGKLEDSDPASWRRIIEINLMGAYYCAKAAIPHLRARRGGKIILIGSGMGHRGIPQSSAYSCSKAGLWMLTQVLAEELRTDGIAVNELIPGPVDSMPPGALTESTAAAVEWLKKPADVVPLALFLATQDEMGPTGQSFSLMRRLK